MKSLEEVERVKRRVEQELMRRPGVTGVAVGHKESGGRSTGVPAIVVFVEHKREVPAEEAIPPEIEGVPTDVVERRFVLH